MEKLFLAWRDEKHGLWLPVGVLTYDGANYKFVYTEGARRVFANPPLTPFPKFHEAYVSTDLFPIFQNRLMQKNRPDYERYIGYLNLNNQSATPLEMLGSSGGYKSTDLFELFSIPNGASNNGLTEILFFAHGLRHLPEESQQRTLSLKQNDPLCLVEDVQNQFDPNAILFKTNGVTNDDGFLVGYCPRYLAPEVKAAVKENPSNVQIWVEAINQPPTPLQFRVRCRMKVKWPQNYQPFNHPDYFPIVNADRVSAVA